MSASHFALLPQTSQRGFFIKKTSYHYHLNNTRDYKGNNMDYRPEVYTAEIIFGCITIASLECPQLILKLLSSS